MSGQGDPLCAWCGQPLPPGRRDAVTCSQRCRQARHRFSTAVGRAVQSRSPRRIAYADPPYPGKAHLYRGHPDYRGEVDIGALFRRLSTYDGWALSTSAVALPDVLRDASCPAGIRVAAWHRGERPHPTTTLWPLSAWEPVIYLPARPVAPEPGRRVDSLVHVARPRTTDPRRVIGAKPATFWRWLFDLLAAGVNDSFDDLFPGSGGGARAWATWAQPTPPADPRDLSR